ncbi:MAG: phage virion morphogenesis protein [Verrucomicrobiaceae bacterium]|nr:phage virion morphogenesis protein [Verrucomicrobiaceae bacterium]
MKFTFRKTRDLISPDLARRADKAKKPKAALEAMGLAVVSLATRAFTQAILRPSTWSPLKAATIKAKKRLGYGSKPLVRSGALAHSPRVIKTTSKTVSVGSDRAVKGKSLAAIHQYGTKEIPARPTWPFDQNGRITSAGYLNVKAAARAALKLER